MMQMQSSLWYDHFSGAAYPLNLTECAYSSSEKKGVKPLIELAASFIVQDSTSTLNAIGVVPQDLFITLLKQALENNRDRSVAVLLAHWPSPSLKVRQLAPDIFSSLKLLHDRDYLVQTGKQGLRYTTCVAQNFLETLKKKSDCRLKYVDMTSYPTAEIITYYLATHCMLAHNEAKQNMMIRKYEEAVKLLPEVESQGFERFTADKSMREDCFGIKFDAFLTSEHALNETCKALKVSSFRESTLRLFVEKLDATCLGQQKIKILLEQLDVEHLKGLRLKYNSLSLEHVILFLHKILCCECSLESPRHLKGLRLKYNSLSSEHFISLCPQLEKLTNITALDLSCNCINVYQNDSACDKLSHLLSQLPFLIRLDLSNNRIKSKVRRILSDIQKPLEYLRLVGCGLMIIDITYLSISHHAQGLRELDLSENSLKLSIPQVITLLKAARMNLKVLELEECDLTDGHFLSLSSSCLMELTGLMYLNISGNFLSLHVTESVVQSVATLSQLQWLIMAYMTGCYDVDNDEVEEQLKTRFREEVNDIMVNQRKSLNIEAMPSVLFKDLEQNMQ